MTQQATKKINEVQTLAKSIADLAAIDAPELDVTDDMIQELEDGRKTIQPGDDSEWEEAWSAIKATLGDHFDDVAEELIQMSPSTDPNGRFKEIEARSESTLINIELNQSGTLSVLARFDMGDGGHRITFFHDTLGSSDPVSEIELGERVVSAELAILASETHSSAQALDTWQTTSSPIEFSQAKWGSILGIGTEAVSNSVRDTDSDAGLESTRPE
jgi:hypothetical protein